MDDKRVRFLVSPLLFFASLTWGFKCDHARTIAQILPSLKIEKLQDYIGILVGGGIAVFTVGFVIGTFTYIVLRLGFKVFGRSQGHEIKFSDQVLAKTWKIIGASGEVNRAKELFAGATFDHGYLRCKNEGVQRWVVRRWNAFSVATTSTMGLFLSILIGCFFSLKIPWQWWLPVTAISFVFIVSAIFAWRDTMGMLSFQAEIAIIEMEKALPAL